MGIHRQLDGGKLFLQKGSSSSRKLHDLILRLRLAEMKYGLNIHLVHVAGTRMIAQGTDGLSRGSLLEGVMAGDDMLAHVDIAKSALERHPPLLDFIRSFMENDELSPLEVHEWFVEAHGIVGGEKDHNGVWIPNHCEAGRTYLWSPPLSLQTWLWRKH